MEEWVENVNDVCQKVDDILNDRIKPEELDEYGQKLDKKALEKMAAREAKKAKEEAERREKQLRGRDGPGDKENYVNFCRKCRVEYTLPTETCVRCGGKTVTFQERREELLGMVDKYKEAKSRKQERKKKWEMWKKTQAIFWKKTATNYEKWEYFTDSEDEFEQLEKNAPPVLPTNDPNFRAMEADLEKRNRDRRQRAKLANDLKKKGNDLLKKKMYDRAIQVYTEGIEVFRNNRYLWSNRALAHLKRGDFQLAIDDCTKMLEYAELMENGYLESKDVNFKFFSRRALGHQGLKKYDLALADIENALKLYPDDQAAQETKKEIVAKIDSTAKLEQLEKKIAEEDLSKAFNENQRKSKEEIDRYLALVEKLEEKDTKEQVTGFDYFKLKDLVTDKQLKLYFFKMKGLDAIKKVLKADAYSVVSGSEKLNFLTFAKCLCEEDALYCDTLVENMFVRNIIKKIMKTLEELFPNNAEKQDDCEAKEEDKTDSTNPSQPQEPASNEKDKSDRAPIDLDEERKKRIEEMYDYKMVELEDLFEMLIMMTENRSVRAYLRDKSHLLLPTFKIIHENVVPKVDREYSVLSSILSFYSNLCMQDVTIKNTEIRDAFILEYIPFVFSFSAKVLSKPANKFLCLKNSCLAFVVNLSTEKKFREHALNKIVTFEGLNKDKKNVIVKEDDFNHVAYFFQSLGICWSTLYNRTSKGELKEHQNFVTKFYEHSTGLLINLFFQLTDKSVVAHMQSHFRRWRLDVVSVDILHNCLKFKLNMGILLNRFINVVAKLGFEDTQENKEKMLYVICELANLFKDDTEENKDFFTDAIRFLASMLQEKRVIGQTAVELTLKKAKGFNAHLRKILAKESNSIMR